MLQLIRFPEYLDTTPGRFVFDGAHVCYSLELPWKDNQRNISCIPKGVYPIEITYSPRFRTMLPEIRNVKNRSGIRIHSANLTSELEGCIAPGAKLQFDTDTIRTVESRWAIKVITTLLKTGRVTTIEII